MAFRCSHCSRKFVSETSLAQHISSKHADVKKSDGKLDVKKYVVIALIGLIIAFSIITVKSYSDKPGTYDDFAKCLTEAGATIYGNDFCQYTGKQLNYFGKSEKYLNYVKCVEDQALCDSKGVTLTPTWEINGEMHKSVQTFEKLSSLTGCEI